MKGYIQKNTDLYEPKLGEMSFLEAGLQLLMKSQQSCCSTLVWQIATEYRKEARLEEEVN